jgi:hypothetical protein
VGLRQERNDYNTAHSRISNPIKKVNLHSTLALYATKLAGAVPKDFAVRSSSLVMSPEVIKQDFESALVKHLSFKARLRSFLYGNSNEQGPLRDPDQCGLGKWITERRLGAYAHLPEIKEIDQRHRDIHHMANRLMDLHLQGKRDEALAGFSAVQKEADYIVHLFQTMEAKLRTLGD